MDTVKHGLKRGLQLQALLGLALGAASLGAAEDVVLDFEQGALGEWIPAWEEQGVSFGLAWKPTKSKAVGSLTFFPHIGTDRQGILAAMATDPIPLEVRFAAPVMSVSATCWAHTGSAARLQAFAADGTLLDTVEIARVPQRTDPANPMPQFELSVTGEAIAFVRFSGPREGEYLAVDELRIRD